MPTDARPPGAAPGTDTNVTPRSFGADFDPLSEAYLADPYPFLTEAREAAPAFYCDAIDHCIHLRPGDTALALHERALRGAIARMLTHEIGDGTGRWWRGKRRRGLVLHAGYLRTGVGLTRRRRIAGEIPCRVCLRTNTLQNRKRRQDARRIA